MNKLSAILLFIFIFLSINILSQSSLFVWGEVKWTTNSPAIGLEIKLIRNATQNDTACVVKNTFTNESGRYAFFNIEGQPTDYSLQVYSGKLKKSERIEIPDINIGGKAPKIKIQ